MRDKIDRIYWHLIALLCCGFIVIEIGLLYARYGAWPTLGCVFGMACLAVIEFLPVLRP